MVSCFSFIAAFFFDDPMEWETSVARIPSSPPRPPMASVFFVLLLPLLVSRQSGKGQNSSKAFHHRPHPPNGPLAYATPLAVPRRNTLFSGFCRCKRPVMKTVLKQGFLQCRKKKETSYFLALFIFLQFSRIKDGSGGCWLLRWHSRIQTNKRKKRGIDKQREIKENDLEPFLRDAFFGVWQPVVMALIQRYPKIA